MKVKIKLDKDGHGSIKLDGKEIARYVESFSLTSTPGRKVVPKLTLNLIAVHVDYDGPALPDGLPADPAVWLAQLGSLEDMG